MDNERKPSQDPDPDPDPESGSADADDGDAQDVDEQAEDASKDSFPASDPPAW